jgi:hypothetical protein
MTIKLIPTVLTIRVAFTMSKIVAIELYSKDGTHFVDNRDGAMSSVEIFCLEDGVWTQDCIPPLVDNDYTDSYDRQQQMETIAIKHMDNENRQLLLTRLNEISRLQQLHDKVIEIEEGDVLVSANGEIIKS